MTNDRTNLSEILKDPTLTYKQRFSQLAKFAENSIQPLSFSQKTQWYIEQNIVYDMKEGAAPFRPRYILPDYDLFLEQGSAFLELDPPKDIWDAVSCLMVLYHHVPSASGTPVYMGHLDRLLEPFVQDEQEATRAIRLLLTHVDRTISDSFLHCNIGPHDTKAGRIILSLTAEMQRPVPNMSFIYDEDITPDSFALRAVAANLITAKPSFVNDRIYHADWKQHGRYAVVSCYNVLPIGGGGSTLCRLNLKRLAEYAQSKEHLMETLLPEACAAMCELIDLRQQYMFDDCRFIENSFLADEGLICADKFMGMFGMVGLAECVNSVLCAIERKDRFGHSKKADDFGVQILDFINTFVENYSPKHGAIYLHAQVGVDSDLNTSPGVRIPVGEEPELPVQLAQSARTQAHFKAGVGDIYPVDETVKRNPQYVLDIVKGAFRQGVRYISFYGDTCDVVRVTGYLVKRSEIEKYKSGKVSLDNSTPLGMGAARNGKALNRRIRSGRDVESTD